MSANIPTDAPPSYEHATGRQTATSPSAAASPSRANHSDAQLQVPGHNAVPDADRRSMEDEQRPLPQGWVRCFDEQTLHQFFVDTQSGPPRSVWHHPFDDEQYLSTLSSEQRERIEHESFYRGHKPSHNDILASHSEEDEEEDLCPVSSPGLPSAGRSKGNGSDSHGTKIPTELPPRRDSPSSTFPPTAVGTGNAKQAAKTSFGRRFKDRVTGTTHAEREAYRRQRAEEEQRLWRQHQAVRRAMVEAMRSGRAVKVGTDEQGRDVFVEPPHASSASAYAYPESSLIGGRLGGGGYGYGHGTGHGISHGNAYSPFAPSGLYAPPDVRYLRPVGPYGRPFGRGYGAGYGLPLALGGGIFGGMLLGGALM